MGWKIVLIAVSLVFTTGYQALKCYNNKGEKTTCPECSYNNEKETRKSIISSEKTLLFYHTVGH